MTNAANTKPEPTTADVLALVTGNRAALRAVNQIFARTAYRPKTIAGKRHTTAAEVERAARHETKINKAIIRLITTGTEAKAAMGTKKAAAALGRYQRAIDAFPKATNLDPWGLPLQLAEAVFSADELRAATQR